MERTAPHGVGNLNTKHLLIALSLAAVSFTVVPAASAADTTCLWMDYNVCVCKGFGEGDYCYDNCSTAIGVERGEWDTGTCGCKCGEPEPSPITYATCIIGNFQCFCLDEITWYNCTDARTGEECLASYGVYYEERQGYVCE